MKRPPRGLIVVEQVAAEEDQVALLRPVRARECGVHGDESRTTSSAPRQPPAAFCNALTFCFARSRVSSNAANESIPRIGSLSCGAEGRAGGWWLVRAPR